jgi:hypothetical protein
VAADDHADLYDLEQSGAGPAGTVIAFNLGTFHRGTALTKPRGARYTMHLGYRPAQVEGAKAGLGQQQPHTRLVPVRAPGDATAARAVRIPAAETSLLESTNNPGDETALNRTRSHTLGCVGGLNIPMRASVRRRFTGLAAAGYDPVFRSRATPCAPSPFVTRSSTVHPLTSL